MNLYIGKTGLTVKGVRESIFVCFHCRNGGKNPWQERLAAWLSEQRTHSFFDSGSKVGWHFMSEQDHVHRQSVAGFSQSSTMFFSSSE